MKQQLKEIENWDSEYLLRRMYSLESFANKRKSLKPKLKKIEEVLKTRVEESIEYGISGKKFILETLFSLRDELKSRKDRGCTCKINRKRETTQNQPYRNNFLLHRICKVLESNAKGEDYDKVSLHYLPSRSNEDSIEIDDMLEFIRNEIGILEDIANPDCFDIFNFFKGFDERLYNEFFMDWSFVKETSFKNFA